MSELLQPKQLLAWLAKLMPRQGVRGSNAVQVGRVDGALRTDHSAQQQQAATTQSAPHATTQFAKSVQNVTQMQHHHNHFYGAAPVTAPAAPPAAAVRPGATPAQKEVLALMKPLPEPLRIRVLDFMRREFQTALVIELQPQQLYRVRRYVETVNGGSNSNSSSNARQDRQ